MKKYFAIRGDKVQELIPVSDKEMKNMFKKEQWGIPQYYHLGTIFKVYPFPGGDVIFAKSL